MSRKSKPQSSQKLYYDNNVFEEGAGHGYRIGMNISLVLMFIGVLEIALLNANVIKLASYPVWLQNLFILLTIILIIPGIAAFGLIWFFRAGKTRLLKESYIEISGKNLIYHKCTRKTGQTDVQLIDFRATDIRKVEEKRGSMIVRGQVQNITYGGTLDGLRIPKAFQNMDEVQRLARYR